MAKTVDTPPGSSKIPKNIKSLTLSGKKTKWTSIQFLSSFQPQGQNDVVDENPTFKSNMSRHPDFDRAIDRLKVHLMIRSGFAEAVDKFNKPITKEWFDEHIFEDDPRFSDCEVTGVIVTTKKDVTGFQIVGISTTLDGQNVKFKSPPISTLKKAEGEGYNYPLIDLFDEHMDTLLLECKEYMAYKSANTQLRMAV